VEDPNLQERLRFLLDTQLGDRRSAWEMRADGSYDQLLPRPGDEERGSQEQLIRWTERRQKQVQKLRKRKPRVLGSRNGSIRT
jgi:polyphosphate kinase